MYRLHQQATNKAKAKKGKGIRMKVIMGMMRAKTEEEFDYWFNRLDKAIEKVQPWIIGLAVGYFGIHFLMFLVRLWG